MAECTIGKTANRRVLGSLNDLAIELQVAMIRFPERSMLENSIWMSHTPMSFIDMESPDRATVAAFAARRVLTAARLR